MLTVPSGSTKKSVPNPPDQPMRPRRADESVLGDWAGLNEAKLHQYADAILGVADVTVVAAYDIKGWERPELARSTEPLRSA